MRSQTRHARQMRILLNLYLRLVLMGLLIGGLIGGFALLLDNGLDGIAELGKALRSTY